VDVLRLKRLSCNERPSEGQAQGGDAPTGALLVACLPAWSRLAMLLLGVCGVGSKPPTVALMLPPACLPLTSQQERSSKCLRQQQPLPLGGQHDGSDTASFLATLAPGGYDSSQLSGSEACNVTPMC
jgi:hypothetical protein